MPTNVFTVLKQEVRHQTLIDRTGLSCGPLGPRAVVLERDALVWVPIKIAVVDRLVLTEEQTAQAIRDGRVCGCGKCTCCSVRAAANENQHNR
jgi:hypothetical protein